jgi:hypothetical protein
MERVQSSSASKVTQTRITRTDTTHNSHRRITRRITEDSAHSSHPCLPFTLTLSAGFSFSARTWTGHRPRCQCDASRDLIKTWQSFPWQAPAVIPCVSLARTSRDHALQFSPAKRNFFAYSLKNPKKPFRVCIQEKQQTGLF